MKNPIVWSVGLAKFAFAGVITLFFRLITPLLGLPNVTPLMATELAGAKAYGPWIAGMYGALGMFLLDVSMGKLGPWTLWTSLCYGTVGVAGGYWLKGRQSDWQDYVKVSIAGTLFFDLVTGIILPVTHGQAFLVVVLGQIPFTARHLAGNIFFAHYAPWFCHTVIGNPTWEYRLIFKST